MCREWKRHNAETAVSGLSPHLQEHKMGIKLGRCAFLLPVTKKLAQSESSQFVNQSTEMRKSKDELVEKWDVGMPGRFPGVSSARGLGFRLGSWSRAASNGTGRKSQKVTSIPYMPLLSLFPLVVNERTTGVSSEKYTDSSTASISL